MSLPGVDLLGPIGRGGMGEVWEGRLIGSGTPVAVKVVTAQAMRRPEFRAALEAEAMAVAALDHPGIVRLYDFGRVPDGVPGLAPGSPYLVMERADGALPGRLRVVPSWTRVREILRALLDALAHAHARGLVHRDLKPENVLVVGGKPKLADFGLAWSLEQHRGALSGVAGSPEYMAPEQVLQKPRLGPWTDLYALGCLGWWLVAGHSPFAGVGAVMHAQVHEDPPPLRARQPVPEGYEGWLRALLRKMPRERVAWAADAALALEALGDAPDPERDEQFPSPSVGRAITLVSTTPPPPARVVSQGALPAVPPAPVPADWRGAESPWRVPSGATYWLAGAPVLGREKERDRMWKALVEVARTHEPRVVLIRGPSGAGKTHLAEWFARRASELGAANVLSVGFTPRGSRGGATSISAPWFTRNFPDQDALFGALRNTAAAHLPQPDNLAQRMAGLVFGTGAPLQQLHPDERRAVIQGLLATIGIERPAMIAMDDAHWEPSSLDFFRAVLQARTAPILMVATIDASARDASDKIEALLGRSDVDVVEVGPFERSDWEPLIAALGEPGRTLAEWADGDAGLAIQVVGSWAEEGLLEATPDGQRFRGGIVPRLPLDLRDLWTHRLAGVPDLERAALAVAAAQGVEIDDAAWRAACEARGIAVADDLLARQVRRGLLHLRRRDGRFTFAHASLAAHLSR